MYRASVASIEGLLQGTLLSSGENIAGGAVGEAVAGWANYALGNTGEIRHIISGVAGGLAGRTVAMIYINGQRLGGRKGVNRITGRNKGRWNRRTTSTFRI